MSDRSSEYLVPMVLVAGIFLLGSLCAVGGLAVLSCVRWWKNRRQEAILPVTKQVQPAASSVSGPMIPAVKNWRTYVETWLDDGDDALVLELSSEVDYNSRESSRSVKPLEKHAFEVQMCPPLPHMQEFRPTMASSTCSPQVRICASQLETQWPQTGCILKVCVFWFNEFFSILQLEHDPCLVPYFC